MARRDNVSRELSLQAFGLSLLTEVRPPGAWIECPPREPVLRLRSATLREIAGRWSGLAASGWEGMIDEAPFTVERGVAGDYRFVHGTRAIHHLSADATVLLCGPDAQGEPVRWRVILDSVLFTVALLGDYEALHAGAIATPDGVVTITAGMGGGKSTLLSELLARGMTLMADDVVVLESAHADAPPLAHPAPPLMTVPAARLAALGERVSRQSIASVGEERWVAVPVSPRPLPLQALVVLNRRPGLVTGLRRVERPLPALLDSLLRFPRTRERERTRFEMAGTIAAHVPVWELDADPSVDPATLAGLLLGEPMEPHAIPAGGPSTAPEERT